MEVLERESAAELAALQDGTALRDLFGRFPSGVAALAAVVDDQPVVMVASSFTVGVSLEPAYCTVAVQNTSATWPVLRRAGRIGVSVLGTGHTGIIRQLAGKDPATRMDGVASARTPGGAVLIDGSAAHLDCRVAHVHPAGDHSIVVLEVLGGASHEQHEPLVFHRSRFGSVVTA